METHPDPLLDLHEQLRQNVLRYMEATAQRSRLQAEMDASLSSLVAAGLAGASSTKVLSGDLDMVGWGLGFRDRAGAGQIWEHAAQCRQNLDMVGALWWDGAWWGSSGRMLHRGL